MKADKKIIFIVDDNKSNLVAGSEALSGTYRVFTLDSGVRLLKMLEKLIPDLILLDVEMPEMNGYEALSLIKRDSRFEHIPVIFLTALDSAETELKGLSLGAADYITKPFFPALLVKRIENHLKLVEYSTNLERMVEEKIHEVITLKNAVLKTTVELVESRDKTTGNHIERTQTYLKIMLDSMKKRGIYEREVIKFDIDLVLQSSQLHDVGKVSIKDTILLKPGKLTPEEFEAMKHHTNNGSEIICRMKESTPDNGFLEYARILAESHHEKWDGGGYPYQLKGEEIPLLGRVMAIADVYDALVSNRPYKKAFSHSEAVDIIKEGKGTHFDPLLVDLFLEIHEMFETAAARLKE
ncbi:MAG: response regulator [Defluviitaleaceae bacterium]|nr:response regulator [Defluviitaleaceae bacterium]